MLTKNKKIIPDDKPYYLFVFITLGVCYIHMSNVTIK